MKPHFHRFRKHGQSKAGQQRWRCAKCGSTRRSGPEEDRCDRFRVLDLALRRRRGADREQGAEAVARERERQRERRLVYLVETRRFTP